MSHVRIGIVGVGTIAKQAHLPSYANREDVDVVAFADPEVERVQMEAEIFAIDSHRPVPNVYKDAIDMLNNENLDAVSICTPNTSHVSLAIEALEAGVHVLLEKPMGIQLSDADALVAKTQQSKKVLMVGMSHRYRQDVEFMKRYVDHGDLGDIYYVKTRILRRRGTPKGWFTDKNMSGGGPLMDIGVHALDLAWWMVGMPQAKSVNGYLTKGVDNVPIDFHQTWTASSSGNQNNEIYDTEDFASSFIRFENGLVLQMEVAWSLHGSEDDALKLDIFGSKGGLSLSPLRFYSTEHNGLSTHAVSVDMGSFYQREIDHFLHCVQNGATPISDVHQGRNIVAMLEGIATSSERGSEVAFKDVGHSSISPVDLL